MSGCKIVKTNEVRRIFWGWIFVIERDDNAIKVLDALAAVECYLWRLTKWPFRLALFPTWLFGADARFLHCIGILPFSAIDKHGACTDQTRTHHHYCDPRLVNSGAIHTTADQCCRYKSR